jgi:hypothetical protein
MASPRPQQHHRISSPSANPPQASTPPLSTYPPDAQQQTFSPFFTLISNPASTVHKHPVVHYVFSDDDFDPIASVRSAPPSKDRVVVVDMATDGESVVAAHSLSEDWQVVGVNVSSAPQWMANDDEGAASSGAAAGGGGLMLTIQGTEGGSQAAKKTDNLYELAEIFNER